MLMTVAFTSLLSAGGNVLDGRQVAHYMRNITFPGYYGNVTIDTRGEVVSYFTLLDYNPELDALVPVVEWSQKTDSIRENINAIDWPNGAVIPPDVCAFEICSDAGWYNVWFILLCRLFI